MVTPEAELKLILQIEANKAQISTHEQVCAERYGAIEKALKKLDESVTALAAQGTNMEARASAAAWSTNWKAWSAAAALFALLISLLAWTSARLYDLEPSRGAVEAAK